MFQCLSGKIGLNKSSMRFETLMGRTTHMQRLTMSSSRWTVRGSPSEYNSSGRNKSKCTVLSFNGWGLTAFDSLDTMLIMGLEDEYQKGLTVVRQANFSVSKVRDFPLPQPLNPLNLRLPVPRWICAILWDNHSLSRRTTFCLCTLA